MSKQNTEVNADLQQAFVIQGGLLGVNLLFIQAFLTIGTHDTVSFISVLASVIAISLLSFSITLKQSPRIKFAGYVLGSFPDTIYFVSSLMGVISSYIALSAAFWFVSWIIGLVFILMVLFAVFLYSYATLKYPKNIGDE